MTTIILNWKVTLIASALALSVGFGTAWHYRGKLDELAKINAVNTAVAATQAVCKANEEKMEELDNAYQDEIDSINAGAAAAMHRLRQSCVPFVAVTSGKHDAPAGESGHGKEVRIEAGELITDSASCDRDTAKLKLCQAYVRALPAR